MSQTADVPLIDSLALWDHQRDALTVARRYVDAFRRGATTGAALVQMPTGSGKSGVIAALSRCVPEVGCVLLLTPRISLRDQLARDVSGRFFRHIVFPLDGLPKSVTVLESGDSLELDGDGANSVIAMTIQKLVQMEKDDSTAFESLCRSVSLLVVDEGHYEPARLWSKAIRKVGAPKLIFTATPYRNDFKLFDIDRDHVFCYSHQAAVEDRYLRTVRVVQRQPQPDPVSFVDDLVVAYDAHFPNPGAEPPRVIVRCDEASAIRQLATELSSRGKTVVGIHETFRKNGGESWERQSVPDPECTAAVFWVHQFKLLEGIDDPRFRMLALYQPPENGRSFVQQVGRVIRNPGRQAGAEAYVLDHSEGTHDELWSRFLEYDRQVATCGVSSEVLATGKDIVDKALIDQPRSSYVDGRFRTNFQFDSIAPNDDVQLPLRTNVLRKHQGFDLDGLVRAILEEMDEEDRVFRLYTPSASVRVVLSIACETSRYLRNHAFFECDLHVAVVRELGDCVAYYETSGLTPSSWEGVGLASPNVKELRRLFAGGARAKLTTVCLKNSNLGTSAIRSRTITAASIEATVPATDDHAQISATAEGYSYEPHPLHRTQSSAGAGGGASRSSPIRRYVGFNRSRISDTGLGTRKLSEYLLWLEHISGIIQSSALGPQILRRYASETPVPPHPAPRSLLLDIEEVRDRYLHRQTKQCIEVVDVCIPVDANGKFRVEVGGTPIDGKIAFVPGTSRYRIECPQLDADYYANSREFPPSIVDCLNRQQSFRVVPESWSTVYVNGQFYSPAFRAGVTFDATTYELGHCFVTDSCLSSAVSEKGATTPGNTGWEPTSLFGMIDALGAGHGFASEFGTPDILVCDDMGKEAADFILCTTAPAAPKVVFVHAKAAATVHQCSASALHVVCSQAVKNLGYLAMFSQQKPSKIASWSGSWSESSIGTVDRRIRRGGTDGKQVWNEIRTAINNPQCDKQVWLFLGGCLSKQMFEARLGQRKPPAEALQAAYLLHGTMAEVAAVGARLRVLCGP